MSGTVAFSPLTRRASRVGSFEDQRRSTWDKLDEAIEAREGDAALELSRFALDGECRFIFDLLTGWAVEIRSALENRGVDRAELARTDARLRDLLAFPDGERYDPELGWRRLAAAVGSVESAVLAGDWMAARVAVPPACEAWRRLHDRVVDASYGWMSAWVERFGEESVPELFRTVAGEHFEEFVELGDPARHSWTDGGCEAVVLDTLEAMRAHLSTRDRHGAPIEMRELEDRYEFEFDPCGSGGRALRGDIVEGTPSRARDPYGFAVIEGAYEWTDGKAGMCVYCNHCQQLYEQWTIDRTGIPFLVVEPPTVSDGIGHEGPRRCRYTIYKDPAAVPDEIFARCGRERPA